MACNIVHIHVDADRDGVIDDTPGGNIWTKGKAGRGAIICVNSDNDDGTATMTTAKRARGWTRPIPPTR